MWRLSTPGSFDPVGPALSRRSLLLITVEGEERDWKIVQFFFFFLPTQPRINVSLLFKYTLARIIVFLQLTTWGLTSVD